MNYRLGLVIVLLIFFFPNLNQIKGSVTNKSNKSEKEKLGKKKAL